MVASVMEKFAARFAHSEEMFPVTMEAMLKHLKHHGLDNDNETGYRGKKIRYKNYKQLRKDSWMHVARTYFSEEGYIQLLEAAGYEEFEEEAREDWRAIRDDSE